MTQSLARILLPRQLGAARRARRKAAPLKICPSALTPPNLVEQALHQGPDEAGLVNPTPTNRCAPMRSSLQPPIGRSWKGSQDEHQNRMLLASAFATISLDVAVTWGGEVVKALAQKKADHNSRRRGSPASRRGKAVTQGRRSGCPQFHE